MSAGLKRSFDSLSVPNYRRYFIGQLVSLSGTWMQTVAALWLVLSLTGSGLAVGLTTALQFLPMLLFGAWGGLLADRFPKRKLLIATQTLMAIPAIGLLAVTVAGVAAPWMVFLAVFAMGCVNAVDNPTRQSFAIEMVGPDRVVNAVSLNSVIVQSARIVGPAIAGLLIAALGVGPCFAVNMLSFGAMIVALWGMDPASCTRAAGDPRARRDPSRPALRARHARAGDSAGADGAGRHARLQLPGDPAAARALQLRRRRRRLRGAGLGDGSRLGRRRPRNRRPRPHRPPPDRRCRAGLRRRRPARARSPSLAFELIALVLLGAAAVTFAATINSSLQLAVTPEMRGRVMALYSVVFLGSTPIGGPLAGWLSQAYDPRWALVLAAISGLSAAWAARICFARLGSKQDRSQGEAAVA